MSSYLALDIGEKRIGVALAATDAPFPAPLTTLQASSGLSTEFQRLLQIHKVAAIIVGFPRNQNGEATQQTKRVQQIVLLLKIPSNIPVYYQDESLTSVKAETELKARKKPYVKADIDALAATYILEDFIKNQINHELPAGHRQSSSQKLDATEQQVAPEAGDADTNSPTPKRGKRKIRFIKSVVILLFFITIAAIVGTSTWYLQAISPKTPGRSDRYALIEVENGSGVKQIAQQLEEEKIIKSSTAFSLYVKLNGINSLQAGTYRLSGAKSVKEITTIMEKGEVTTVDLLIAPGLRLDQIIDKLEKEGFAQSEIDKALSEVRDHPMLRGLPTDVKLEGYLFPNTYKIDPNTSATKLITLMLDAFEKQVTPEIKAGISAQGLNMRQAVILASIIQKEVSQPEVQRTVAQVFLKRLSEKMPLGSDVTYMYAAAVSGKVASPTLSSPYNTRQVTGLPPTAISNFNIDALKAVSNPTSTDYLYFVAGDDGQTYFSKTLEEHEALVKKYCTQLCG